LYWTEIDLTQREIIVMRSRASVDGRVDVTVIVSDYSMVTSKGTNLAGRNLTSAGHTDARATRHA
jgi:hypothetical protein